MAALTVGSLIEKLRTLPPDAVVVVKRKYDVAVAGDAVAGFFDSENGDWQPAEANPESQPDSVKIY